MAQSYIYIYIYVCVCVYAVHVERKDGKCINKLETPARERSITDYWMNDSEICRHNFWQKSKNLHTYICNKRKFVVKVFQSYGPDYHKRNFPSSKNVSLRNSLKSLESNRLDS
jgi:hypothetical protein